jgi:dynactin complex subunit
MPPNFSGNKLSSGEFTGTSCRLQKNRQSAAQSRQRKKEYISNLQKQVNKLTQENQQYQMQVNKLTTQTWESKIHVERLEKEILKLLTENNELKIKLKEMGVSVDKPKTLQDLALLSSMNTMPTLSTMQNMPPMPPLSVSVNVNTPSLVAPQDSYTQSQISLDTPQQHNQHPHSSVTHMHTQTGTPDMNISFVEAQHAVSSLSTPLQL